MAKYKVELIVEVDEEKLSNLGYDNAEDYLNECRFEAIDDEDDDIVAEVREYEEID